MTKIGFIGLGIMGKPMAKNLLQAGHELVVFNRSAGPVQELVAAGATAGSSAADVAAQVEIAITMLPNSPDVQAVVTGKNGVLEGARAGLILIDMSSIAPGVAKEVSHAAASKNVIMLDAPVSGGEPKAVEGSLAIMVGGPEETFEKVKPILLNMGASAVHVGDIGAGNITKLANQVIVGINIAAMAEALTLATKAGADPAKVVAAISGGLAGSTVLNAKAPMVLDGNFKPGFRMELHIKDLKNAVDTADDVTSPLPLSKKVLEQMQALAELGHQSDDHGGLIQFYEAEAGVKVRNKPA